MKTIAKIPFNDKGFTLEVYTGFEQAWFGTFLAKHTFSSNLKTSNDIKIALLDPSGKEICDAISHRYSYSSGKDNTMEVMSSFCEGDNVEGGLNFSQVLEYFHKHIAQYLAENGEDGNAKEI